MAESIENGTPHVDGEAVVVADVFFGGAELFAFDVDEFSATFAFAVVANGLMTVIWADVFKGGRICGACDIFHDESIRNQFLQLSVDRGGADGGLLRR